MSKYDSGVFFQNASPQQSAAAQAADRFNYGARMLRPLRDRKQAEEYDAGRLASAWSAAVAALVELAEVVDADKIRPYRANDDHGEVEVLEFFRNAKIGKVRWLDKATGKTKIAGVDQ
jgi:hypothetical protein